MKNSHLGAIISTFAAIAWGYVYVNAEGMTEKLSPSATLAASYSLRALLVSPLLFYYQSDILHALSLNPRLFLSGALTALVADFAIIWSISLVGSTSAGLIEVSYPLWTAAFLYLLYGKQPNSATILGGCLILLGVAIIGTWGGSRHP